MRVLVIGTGFGKHAAAPAYESAGFEVEVVSPRDDAAIRRGLASGIDLVSVHSPPFLHLDHVAAALDAGHAVLCDKPFGRTADEAEEMVERARNAGVLHFLNFEFRCRESWARVKELAEAGAIGTLTHLSWNWFGSGLRGRRFGWINDADLGGGWIGAYGSHLIDYTRWLLGGEIVDCGGVTRIDEPIHPDADGVLKQATAEDAYAAWFLLDNGATAAHDTGFATATPTTPRAVLLGTDGSIELTADTRLVLRTADGDPQTVEFDRPGRPDPALTTFFTQIAEALRTGAQISPSFDDGLAVARVMERLRVST
ncbi:Gfo/Idh/MocA family protein [Mycolicibacterium litorale]|uniref:Oxidoreductase n=1 Tax=Mycolicibacterium litorale TaxID=758802 RepID=A0AAD1IPF2_9MYCO|nr:Gfo/Idh/MocA family oxidoreductase [Mycolicibacterium litorale]MCV7418384.1 Gfo/Idh/MocA family oxidoreductase [Mycolicibacterium litorale]TDY06219.1 putative dehydrogenase [Mycolicibacterium litorale]BBY19637.1 oxidoreductase [Mycolicibacterium litorale]